MHVIIEMSKMIKKEFMSASQIFAAFQHHGKFGRNKILHDISQKTEDNKFQRNKKVSPRKT